MFETIARLSIRFRWLVLALWFVIPLVAARSLPPLSSVTTANNAQFLSAGDPSQRAAALAAPFQGKNVSSTAILLDTFFVRTLLVPSVAVLLGRWNWWPSRLSRPVADQVSATPPGLVAGPTQSPTGGPS